MPAAKKDASVRARRNRAATAATLTSVLPAGRRPELPVRGADREGVPMEWHPQTLEWWQDVWSSPMAGQYHSSDRHALFMIALLVDDMWTATSRTARTETAAEIRLQRMAFGLTPYDRRRLEWTIEQAAEAQARGVARRTSGHTPAGTPTGKKDPRRALQAVPAAG